MANIMGNLGKLAMIEMHNSMGGSEACHGPNGNTSKNINKNRNINNNVTPNRMMNRSL